jgi:hypothetical protein
MNVVLALRGELMPVQIREIRTAGSSRDLL